jgi:thiamine biosynthesis lipoprotein
MRSVTILFLLFSSLLLHAAMQKRTRVLMGTYVSVILESRYNKETSQAFDLVALLEKSLSTFDANASLAKLNATHGPVTDPALAEALLLAKRYYRDTDGYYDVTIGSITKKLYRFGEAKPHSPSPQALAQAPRNINGIHIDTQNAAIYTNKNITVDLGGMGKGYAADKVASWLIAKGIDRGIVALSGDIRCIGICTLFLQSPFREMPFAKVTALVPDLSVSTSGTYRRYATQKSEHHLIDPKLAHPERNFLSVSLFTRADNSRIDAYATAVAVMPKARALAFLKAHPHIGYVLITTDKSVLWGQMEGLITIEWAKAWRKKLPFIMKSTPSKAAEKRDR